MWAFKSILKQAGVFANVTNSYALKCLLIATSSNKQKNNPNCNNQIKKILINY